MYKKSLAVFFFLVVSLFAVNFALAEPAVKGAKDLISELAPSSRGLIPRPADRYVAPVAETTGHSDLAAVQFIYDSAKLLPVAKRQLDQLVLALHDDSLRNVRIQLVGHTDAAGSREYNRILSIRRAESAARYLIQVHRVSAHRVIPIGMGEEYLLDRYNPLGAINRRVEIITLQDI